MIKPTIRDVRVVLNSMGIEFDGCHFNDKRKNGGRIKLYGYKLSPELYSKMNEKLSALFPELGVSVYEHCARGRIGARSPIGWRSVCIKWGDNWNPDIITTNSQHNLTFKK